jgi:thioredoxin-related protein
LATEKQTIEKQLQMTTDTINQSTLFAGKYMQFKLTQEEKLAKVWESEEQQTIAKNYFTNLDFDALYGSSMWFAIINLCREAYVKESPYHQIFGEDVVENLKRIKNQQVYEDLIDAAISITQKYGWNKDEEAIVKFIVKDKRIKNPQGKLLKIMQSNTVFIGKKGPDLLLTNWADNKTNSTVLKTNQLNAKYSLLLFYQTGCGYCETLLTGIKSHYPALTKKGIKTISIAGDTDQDSFTKSSSDFPWQNKYRDLEGMNGTNFKNYGVIGTPTLFLVNSKGIIIEKMATVEQLLVWIEKS